MTKAIHVVLSKTLSSLFDSLNFNGSNNKSKYHIRQEKFKESINEDEFYSFVDKSHRRLPRYQQNNKSALRKQRNMFQLLNQLIRLVIKHPTVYISQSTVAHYVGISRQTACKLLNQLADQGFIYKQTNFRETCLYKVHPAFFTSLRHAAQRVLPALKEFSLLLLYAVRMVYHSDSRSQRSTLTVFNNEYYMSIFKHTFSKLKGDICALIYNALALPDRKECIRTLMQYVLSPELQRIQQVLGLTDYAVIRLLAFDGKTIKEAFTLYGTLQRKRDVSRRTQDPYPYFFKLCTNIARKHNRIVYWYDMGRYLIASGFSPSSPIYKGNRTLFASHVPPKFTAAPVKETESKTVNTFANDFPFPFAKQT